MIIKYAIKEFIDDRKFKQLSSKTLSNYSNLLDEFYIYCIEQKEIVDVDDVMPTIVKSFLLSCQEKGNSPATVNT